MPKCLLHICCGICALASIERIREEGFSVKGLFFNPNIHPYSEYIRRKETAQNVANITDIKIIERKYSVFEWFNLCKEYSHEQEGGTRCKLCYESRLQETFKICLKERFDYFTTTLTISPHKTSSVIFEIGKRLGGDKFLCLDFKKKEGFKKSVAKAKENNLYRQNYCGCVYSLRDHKLKDSGVT